MWYVVPEEVKSETLLKRYFELLSPCEKKNVLRMRGDELQKRALLARALVRTTIARYVGALVLFMQVGHGYLCCLCGWSGYLNTVVEY